MSGRRIPVKICVGGAGGFGGAPATVGINRGDGVDSMQFGRFGVPGFVFDGPGGMPDGIDFLDNLQVCLDVSIVVNTPPDFTGSTTFETVELGDTLEFTVSASGPEVGDTVVILVDFTDAVGTVPVTVSGNPATAMITYTPTISGQLGTNEVRFRTWNWQYWYRDFDSLGVPTSNFSNAISVTFL